MAQIRDRLLFGGGGGGYFLIPWGLHSVTVSRSHLFQDMEIKLNWNTTICVEKTHTLQWFLTEPLKCSLLPQNPSKRTPDLRPFTLEVRLFYQTCCRFFISLNRLVWARASRCNNLTLRDLSCPAWANKTSTSGFAVPPVTAPLPPSHTAPARPTGGGCSVSTLRTCAQLERMPSTSVHERVHCVICTWSDERKGSEEKKRQFASLTASLKDRFSE